MSTPWEIVLVAVWTAVFYGLQVAFRRWRLRQQERGKVPWAPIRAFSAWGSTAGNVKHGLIGVSRHDIAESGLVCPVCHTLAAARGDFSRVRRTMINGEENEVVECFGQREVEDGREVPCGTYLAASPDTEHGDHLDDNGNVVTSVANEPLEHFRFVRVTKAQALREQLGADVRVALDADGAETLVVSEDQRPTERILAKGTKHDVLVGAELLAAIQRDLENRTPPHPHPVITTDTGTLVPKDPRLAVPAGMVPKQPKAPSDPRLADTQKLSALTEADLITAPPT